MVLEVRQRRQQRQQRRRRRRPQKHNYPLRSLLYVVINIAALVFAVFLMINNNVSVAVFAMTTTAVIMEEEEQQRSNNNNNDNNVCTWSDEHGKERCANSNSDDGDGDDIKSDDDDDDDDDDDEKKKELIKKKDKKTTNQFLPTSEGGRDYLDDDYFDDDDDDDDDDYSSSGGRNNNYEDDDEYLENYLEWPEEDIGEEFDVWTHGDKSELYYELKCDNQEQGDDEQEHITNIHTKETWEIFNTVYNQILVESTTTQSVSSIPSKYDTNGYHYPIEIKYDPIVGRGVYALQEISKGSLLYTSINTATFLEGQTFRNFLKALSTNHNKKLACDVMIWSYVRLIKPIKSKSTVTVTGDNKNNNEDDNDNDNDDDDDDDDDDEYIYYDNSEDDYMICCDLDEGSFINSADYEYQYNMALGTTPGGILYNDPTITNQEKIELWYGCEMKFYASQDIKMGEEIRADYSDFVESDGWKFLGL